MKFTDGQWLNKSKYVFNYAAQVFDADFNGQELTVYTYTKPVENRAQTIDQGTITMHFTSECEDSVHVRLVHHEGRHRRFPEFALIADKGFKPSCVDSSESIQFTSGRLTVVIAKNPCSITYFYDGKKLTSSVPHASAHITELENGGSLSTSCFMREQLSLNVGEYVYGLGERFTAFTKNGQTVDMWNEDGGTASELTYKNIPFYVTNRNYGVFVRHSEKVSFEVASEHVERVQFSVPGESLEYIILGGSCLKDVIARYTALTGRPALPPAWTFGLWLTTSFTTSYDEKTVSQFIDGMSVRKLPLHVFHFDCFWMSECQWCNFTWDIGTFSEPEAMLARLKERGLKICVWINPYIAQKSPLFAEAMQKHYLLETSEGDVWQWDRWQAGMALVDFTNPDAYIWYQAKLKVLLDMGVDCFKTDFGERLPVNVVYHDGSDAVKMHNFYTFLYNKCVFELLESTFGKNKAALFARSATAGCQQFPVHWGGDCWGTYESMAESLRGGLSLCMSGFGFWSHDISGFEKTATPDLYKRWVAFGLLSTHSRLHGSSSYRVPWLFDEEAVDVLRFFTNLRCRLVPYLWAQAQETARTGCPMMRSMIFEFAESACRFLDTQYMLGESLLVAPVFSETGNATFYLPEGIWTNWFSGETVSGGRYFENTYDYFHLPLYQRSSSIIALGASENQIEYDYADGVTFCVAPLVEGASSAATVYAADSSISARISVEKTGNMLTFSIECKKPFNIEVLGVTNVSTNNCKIEKSTRNSVFLTCTESVGKKFSVEIM